MKITGGGERGGERERERLFCYLKKQNKFKKERFCGMFTFKRMKNKVHKLITIIF